MHLRGMDQSQGAWKSDAQAGLAGVLDALWGLPHSSLLSRMERLSSELMKNVLAQNTFSH